tara:strand:- start:32 stop:253 length:222 start_codon:yes stop_codon:yes gene_type:complete
LHQVRILNHILQTFLIYVLESVLKYGSASFKTFGIGVWSDEALDIPTVMASTIQIAKIKQLNEEKQITQFLDI